jgi:hypothetical protein
VPVGSYLELVLTTFGWHLYDLLWSILSETGIAYLPFLAVILKNISDPIQSQDARSAAATSLRRMELDIVRMLLVLFICVSPSFQINYGEPTLSNACSGVTVKEGVSGTVFDEVFGPQLLSNGGVASVPPWFYLILSISGGINSAFIASLPCDLNIRGMKTQASTARIDDLHLKEEVNRFIGDCYHRARFEYLRNTTKIDDMEDINWVGSKYLIDKYYPDIYATNPIVSWTRDPNRESDSGHTSGAYPGCDEWWLNEKNGLRRQLIDQYPADGLTKLNNIFHNTEETENAAIRKILQNEKQSGYALDLTNAPDFSLGGDSGVSVIGTAKGAVEWVGGAVTALTVSFVTDFIVMSAPFIQALALFSIYFLLPIALVIGGYEISTVKTATVTVFAIKFWTSIWAVVALMDDKLTTALTVRDGLHPIDYISLTVGFAGIITNILIAAMYISLPMLLMTMMAWAGERNASAASEMSKGSGSAASGAGSSSAGIAKSGASKASGGLKS